MSVKKTLAHITWMDPQSHVGWFSIEDVKEMQPAIITSVGFLIRESKGMIAISTSACDNGDLADPLVIPKKLILRIKKEKYNE